MANPRKHYKPGDTHIHEMLEFIARDEGNGNDGCNGCIGSLHDSVCDMLPSGCGNDQIVWKPSNESAKTLHAILKLEGTI